MKKEEKILELEAEVKRLNEALELIERNKKKSKIISLLDLDYHFIKRRNAYHYNEVKEMIENGNYLRALVQCIEINKIEWLLNNGIEFNLIVETMLDVYENNKE